MDERGMKRTIGWMAQGISLVMLWALAAHTEASLYIYGLGYFTGVFVCAANAKGSATPMTPPPDR